MAVTRTTKKNVRFGRIRLPKGFNIRGDELPEKERDVIIRSFEEHGVIHDASVEEHVEDGETVYLVTEGFGRMGALLFMWEKQGKPEDWEVTVTVVEYSSRVDPFMRNLAENVHRRAVKQADLARRLWEMVNGMLRDPKGGFVKKKVTVAELAKKLQLSEGYVRDLVRAWDKSIPAVREAWRKEQIRTDHARAWASLPEPAQKLKLEATLRGEQTLAPRKVSKTNGALPGLSKGSTTPRVDSDGSVEEEGAAAPIAASSSETPRGAEPRPRESRDEGPRPPSRSEMMTRIAMLEEDLDSGRFKGTALEARRAAWTALRWAVGDVRSMRLPS